MYSRLLMVLAVFSLSACSVNPATGDRQFTALMSPQQEVAIGRQEHPKALKAFGGAYDDKSIQAYVEQIGQNLVRGTERQDVSYRFTVLDSPVVNAFAIPGGYVYVTRGLLALANSEAEVAGVIGHEIGHVTGRHSAERYSQSVVVGLLGAVVTQSLASDIPRIGDVTSLGSDLFLKSYSRGQELEADTLGIRYIARQGYDPFAVPHFLESLDMDDQLQAKLGNGNGGGQMDFFATHPRTADRVVKALQEAGAYPVSGQEKINHDFYLKKIDGMVYGSSPNEGYVRGNMFIHPKLGFMFEVPKGFKIENRPSEVLARNGEGVAIIFDTANGSNVDDPQVFLTGVWAPRSPLANVERISVNGLPAATATLTQNSRSGPVDIRLVAIRWTDGNYYRFVFVTPTRLTRAYVEPLRATTHTLRRLSAEEARQYPPLHIRVVEVKDGDTVGSLSARMSFDDFREERFRALNRLGPSAKLRPGDLVKIVTIH